MLTIQDLHLSYGENEVLKGIDLSVKQGDVVTFIGPSGTGKTTLLKCLNFLERPSKGTVEIGDTFVDYQKVNRRDVMKLRQKTAMVFQQFNLFKHRTVLQNTTDPLTIVHKMSKDEAREIGLQQLERVGLLDKKDEYPARLSGGQQQRVGIARAFAVNPDVILFDEPTSSLDPELVDGVLNVIESLTDSGMTILLVTHEMSFARKISSRVIFMESGHIVEQGPPELIFSESENPRTRSFLKSFYTAKQEDPITK